MNKQEVIKKIREIYAVDSSVNHVINLINQIEEPQKVVVPRFIDSFIQYAKNEDMSLYIAMDNAQNPEEEWIIENEDLFARAWLDGYDVEREKLYTVEIFGATLYKAVSANHIRYHMVDYRNLPNSEGPYTYTSKLTEKEIKATDERLWKFAKEVE